MSGKLQFREKLNGILELGKEKHRVLAMEDVEKYFEEDALSEEQMELVYDYLLSQKIAVTGYVKKGGTVLEEKEEKHFSNEEEIYLETYLEEMSALRPQNEIEEKLKQYFPKVVEIAKELHNSELFIGDLIRRAISVLCLLWKTKRQGKQRF